MPDALRGTTVQIYPGLGQAPNMLACIAGGLNGDQKWGAKLLPTHIREITANT